MKKLLINLFLVLFTTILSAQTTHFWGTTEFGGQDNAGTIYKLLNDGTQHEAMHKFEVQNPGSYPIGDMVEAPDGMLYGVTQSQGSLIGPTLMNLGILFKYNPDNNNIVTIKSFNYKDTINPISPLALGPDSNLYGFSDGYSVNRTSFIFRYNFKKETIEIVTNLNENTGYDGLYKLTLGSNNKFYGVNTKGGIHGAGTLFELDCYTNSYRKIHDFHRDTSGLTPNNSLLPASNGIFYGTCKYSYNSNGALYAFDPTTDSVKFTNIIVGEPASNLIEHPNGVLHGSSNLPDIGGIFQYNISTDSIFYPTTFHFNSFPLGFQNKFLLTKYSKILFASNWSNYFDSRIYEYFPQNGALKTIQAIENPTDLNRISGLIETSKGKAFGTFFSGGIEDEGFLFSLDSINSSDSINFRYQKRLDFGYSPEGRNPRYAPTYANGKFFGLCSRGGKFGKGVLYSYDPEYKKYKVHISFNDSTGANPQGEILYLNDKLYGICKEKGRYNGGSLFEFDPINESFKILSFFYSPNGIYGAKNPLGSITNIGNKLYGVCSNDNSFINISWFEFNLIDSNLRTLDYIVNNGPPSNFYPSGGLFYASDGNLYGLIDRGKNVVYRYEPSNDSLAILLEFGSGGSFSNSLRKTFIEHNQKLYAPLGLNSTLLEFNFTDTSYAEIGLISSNSLIRPQGKLTESKGKFYEVSNLGLGNIFKYNFNTDSMRSFYQFDGFNGAWPSHSIIEISACSTLTTGLEADSSGFKAIIENASFQWLKCDEEYKPVLGETNSTFSPSDSALYALEISKYGCKDTSSCVSLKTVGIHKIPNFPHNINPIFPNPFKESFQFKTNLQQPTIVKIYSKEGKKVYEKTILSNEKISPMIKPGVYILEIVSSNQIERQTIIKL